MVTDVNDPCRPRARGAGRGAFGRHLKARPGQHRGALRLWARPGGPFFAFRRSPAAPPGGICAWPGRRGRRKAKKGPPGRARREPRPLPPGRARRVPPGAAPAVPCRQKPPGLPPGTAQGNFNALSRSAGGDVEPSNGMSIRLPPSRCRPWSR